MQLAPLLETQYLPCLAWFGLIAQAEEIYLERHEFFEKQTYRNRCYINTRNGPAALIVPLTGKHGKTPILDVRIDYSQKWLNNHWRTVCSAYGKAPFFEYYAADLEEVLFRKFGFLYELNFHLLTMCLKWLGYSKVIKETLSYEKVPGLPVINFRSFINPKNKLNTQSVYKAVPYYQVFGNHFAENLSIVDLVFCCGPQAASVISASCVRREQIQN